MTFNKIIMFLAMISICGFSAPSWAVEERIAENNFVTNTMIDAFDTMRDYATGKKSVLDSNWAKDPSQRPHPIDSLDRKMNSFTIRSINVKPADPASKTKPASQQ